jgi:hypothetical protein
MLKYNISQTPGKYQSFTLKIENNFVNFFDHGGYEDRNESTIGLICDAIKESEHLFLGKRLEILFNTSDQTSPNSIGYANPNDIKRTVPCFTFDKWEQIGIDGFDLMKNRIIESANKDWKINKLFWSGSVGPWIPTRVKFEELAKIHSDLLICNRTDLVKENPKKVTAPNFVSLPEHCDYKYLIDLEGIGWSARLKFLCFTKRVLFVNKRPYQEFWMDGLKDFENCIFVERDLSDLVEKLNYIEKNPKLYDEISNNMFEFATKTFTKENINKQIINLLLN